MKITRIHEEHAEIDFSLDELDLLRNGLNEARLAVKGDADFDTRLGSPKAEADRLIEALQLLIGDMMDLQAAKSSSSAVAPPTSPVSNR